MTPALAAAPDLQGSRAQRVNGHARVRFTPTGVGDLYQRAPARFLFPRTAPGEPPLAVAITTSGGLTGGDRLSLEIAVDAGAHGVVTTQAAEKLYRVLDEDPDIRIDTRIEVADGGRCEWLSQEAIVFDRSRFRRTLTADLAGDARLLAVETIVLGRAAMGERFRKGLVHDSWRIRRDGRLAWADALHLTGGADEDRFGLAGATAIATLLYVGTGAAAHLGLARTLADGPGAGATSFDDLLILRWADADAQALKRGVMRAAAALRAAAFGLSPTLPATWLC